MATTNESDIKILNGLIETTLDSADGYSEAAKEARNPRFTTLFQARATERQHLIRQLQAEVVRLGGAPEDSGTMLAAAHRAFLNLKSSVTGSDQSVVDEVEAGEDHVKAKFEAALDNEELSPSGKALVTRIYGSIKAGHDEMSQLKHELKLRAAS
ncbi:PA2169 family four-helix-bundle protein [Limobrevibacterium gyesilva]|uniref:PA2169 family four-helix-bundle protein n=1 Tax=Limobrevibacterium gyesilva TaxID=2991712 RepID=A0AA41YQT0_9PROT|nr:PA2169 family four-helix-bundle protein [Limobrevibacterium gyesilva]MCW3477150.1 PA2169 family four-helix-bundle protein [Limobrevibacterium gyesilva]